MKRSLALFLTLVMTISLLVSPVAYAKKWTIVNVPKVSGIAWFDRMNEGVKRFV